MPFFARKKEDIRYFHSKEKEDGHEEEIRTKKYFCAVILLWIFICRKYKSRSSPDRDKRFLYLFCRGRNYLQIDKFGGSDMHRLFPVKVKQYSSSSYEIEMDTSIDPYLQKNLCYLIHLLSRFDKGQGPGVQFYLKNELVEDSDGDKSYLGVFFEPCGEEMAEIKISTVDYEELKKQDEQGQCEEGACYPILKELGEYCIRYMVWKRYPILTKSQRIETVITKIWSKKILEKQIEICLKRTQTDKRNQVPEGMMRKYIITEKCHYIVDMDKAIEDSVKATIYHFLQKIAEQEEHKSEVRFSFVNQIMKNSKQEEVTGTIKLPPVAIETLTPLIKVSVHDFTELKNCYGKRRACNIILHDIGWYYSRYCFWRDYPKLRKIRILEEIYLKVYERRYVQ